MNDAAIQAAAELIDNDRRNHRARIRQIPADATDFAAAVVRAYLDALDPAQVRRDVWGIVGPGDSFEAADVIAAVRP